MERFRGFYVFIVRVCEVPRSADEIEAVLSVEHARQVKTALRDLVEVDFLKKQWRLMDGHKNEYRYHSTPKGRDWAAQTRKAIHVVRDAREALHLPAKLPEGGAFHSNLNEANAAEKHLAEFLVTRRNPKLRKACELLYKGRITKNQMMAETGLNPKQFGNFVASIKHINTKLPHKKRNALRGVHPQIAARLQEHLTFLLAEQE